jgi:hypothetical protein
MPGYTGRSINRAQRARFVTGRVDSPSQPAKRHRDSREKARLQGVQSLGPKHRCRIVPSKKRRNKMFIGESLDVWCNECRRAVASNVDLKTANSTAWKHRQTDPNAKKSGNSGTTSPEGAVAAEWLRQRQESKLGKSPPNARRRPATS